MNASGNRLNFNYSTVFITLVITFLNLVTHETVSALFISIPEIAFMVLLFLTNSSIHKIFYYHLVFTFTTFSIPFSQIINPGEVEYGLFNYSKLKLIGPLSVSQVILIFILIKSVMYNCKIPINKPYKSFFLSLLYLFFSGTVIGLFGFIISTYNFSSFLSYSIYMLTLLIYFTVYLQITDEEYNQKLSSLLVSLLISAPISSFLSYYSGFTTFYGNQVIARTTEVAYYSACLVIALVQFKFTSKTIVILVSLLCYLFLIFDGGMGGKGVFIFISSILISGIILFKRSLINLQLKHIVLLSFLSIFSLVTFIILDFNKLENNYQLATYKLESLILLVETIFNTDSLHLLPNSPKVRVVELILIVKSMFNNPIFLLFGHGYGGYFMDSGHLLSSLDLSTGFSKEDILTGRFSKSHDTFTVVPFLHGLMGVGIIAYFGVKYTLKVSDNFLFFSAIPFLLLSLYFNHQFATFGLLMILTALYNYKCRKNIF